MATVTSNASCSPSTISVSDRNTSTGTISWSLPSLPSGAIVQSCVLTGTASSFDTSNKGAKCSINGTSISSGQSFSINLGTNNTTSSVSVSFVGNHKQTNTSVSFSNLVYTVTYALAYTVTFKDWDGTTLKTQTVNEGSSATPPSNPTREGYTFTGWSGSYTNVTSNTTVTAQYSINTYTVTFRDWDGTTLKTETVNHGGSATPPNPTREGYTLIGWNGGYTNITSNRTLTAQYSINTYTVTFKDWDNTTLKTQTVEHGSSATPPNPTREGYNFTGWDKSYTNITSDVTIIAQYSIKTYTVTFKDWDGTTLKTETVNHGNNATAPSNPTREGYNFTGWDRGYTNITASITITAQYSIKTYTVTFKDWDGTTLKTETVNHGSDATPPSNPSRDGYIFNGWEGNYTNITASTTIIATYLKKTATLNLKIGETTINNVRLGNTTITKIYVGDILIFES